MELKLARDLTPEFWSRFASCSDRVVSSCRHCERRRLDVDDRIGDLRERRHQPILHDVRQAVRFVAAACRGGTRRADRGTCGRPSRASGCDGSRRLPATPITTRRMSSSASTTRSARMRDVSRAICAAGARDEHGDRPARRSRSSIGIAEPHGGERDQHGARRQHVAARVRRIGEQQLAVQPPRLAPPRSARPAD